jgi:cytochrome c
MAIRLKDVDVVLACLGLTEGILAKELLPGRRPHVRGGRCHQEPVHHTPGTPGVNLAKSLTAAIVCSLTLVCAAGLRAGDVEKGKALFEKCAACHSLEVGHNEEGPNLAGIFGRKAASVQGYRYSAALKRSDVVWTDDTLDTFIQDPQAFIAGNRMPFDGLKDKGERDDLLAYLKQATAPASAKQMLRSSAPRRAGL